MLRKFIYRLLRLLSRNINKLLGYSNPIASSLSSNNDISLTPIKNRNINSNISKVAKLYPPYKIEYSEVGAYSYIAENSRLNQTKIGKFCSIGPNLISGYGIHPTNGLSTSPMFYSTLKQNGSSLSNSDKIQERKPINIGNDVFIGMNVIILDGITIGDGAIIGAGSVVTKDIPPYSVAVGSPIRIIRKRFLDDQIEKLLKIKWWDFEEEKLKDVETLFFDIEQFINKYY